MTKTDREPRRGNALALAHARAVAAAHKHRDVVAALTRAKELGHSHTVSSLAAAAEVSRQFIYSRPDLVQGLRQLQEHGPTGQHAPLTAARTADLINAQETIKRLKSEVRDLNRKLDAGLAAQIELRDEKRIRQLYEHRGLEIERLLTRNADLTRTVAELRELVRSLEDDLAIERNAVKSLAGRPANVTSIGFEECRGTSGAT